MVFYHDDAYFENIKIPFEPEGIMGTVNCIGTAFIGLFTGEVLAGKRFC